jgi:hypothetical protein
MPGRIPAATDRLLRPQAAGTDRDPDHTPANGGASGPDGGGATEWARRQRPLVRTGQRPAKDEISDRRQRGSERPQPRLRHRIPSLCQSVDHAVALVNPRRWTSRCARSAAFPKRRHHGRRARDNYVAVGLTAHDVTMR